MIKIIKKGKIPKKYITKYEITCPFCKTVFECDKSDIFSNYSGFISVHSIGCPFCKERIYLEECSCKIYEVEQKEKEK